MNKFLGVFDRNGKLIATSFKRTTLNQIEFYDFRNRINKRFSVEHFEKTYVVKTVKSKAKTKLGKHYE